MAKWGEGDPRWIVEERPDATNVNNWHCWLVEFIPKLLQFQPKVHQKFFRRFDYSAVKTTEKDASVWSQDKLNTLLVGLTFDGPEGTCQTTEAPNLQGEATVNNRKGKLIFIYDWEVKLQWTGTLLDVEKKVSGEIEIPNLSDEHEVEDVDVIVTTKKSSPEAQKLKELMHRVAPAVIRGKLDQYLRCLKEEYSQGVILPRRVSEQLPTSQQNSSLTTDTRKRSPSPRSSSPASRPSGSKIGYRLPTTKITLTESFKTSVDDLFTALTSQELVQAFTRNSAKVEAWKGGAYSIMDGQITGQFVEVERPTKIVQRWRQTSWPANHYSKVTLELQQESDCAKLTLRQTEIPESDSDRTRDGWKRYIFESIKSTFGYGARLF